MSPSIKEVAAAAGVSVGTVSNVLNKPHLVSETTRTRVIQAINDLGFVRNESARQLRAGTSRAVGLVVMDAGNPFFTDVARGVEEAVEEAGGAVLLGNSAGSEHRQQRYLDLFEQLRVRGVLIAPTSEQVPSVQALTRMGIPVVFLDRYPEGAPYSSVSVDDVAGGRLAAAHLLGNGHRHLAFVGGPSTIPQVRNRRTGAEDAAAAVPNATLLTISSAGMTIQGGREGAEHLVMLPRTHRPTAVVAANDLVALGLLQGFTTHGFRVPDDVAIVGYDDIVFAASAAVPLSSVRQPREELGRTGAALLFAEIEARRNGRTPTPQQVVFEPQLVVRRSSGTRRSIAG